MRIDLNSDLGEGYGAWTMGDDQSLLEVVTSANIACGFHAGDPSIMRRSVLLAAQRGVSVGAHVSYPDLRGFGRRDLDLPSDEISDDVLYQIGALDAMARAAGTRVAYVKPHGALYNRMTVDEVVARAVIDGVAAFDAELPLLALHGSVALDLVRKTRATGFAEGFADRAYDGDGRLVSRRLPGAVIHDPRVVAERAVEMALHGRVISIDGRPVTVRVESLCVHGDTPGAVDLARAVRGALEAAGIGIARFTQSSC
jgi:5-oxoprolinase (ATP-hydrolysing) subunit A